MAVHSSDEDFIDHVDSSLHGSPVKAPFSDGLSTHFANKALIDSDLLLPDIKQFDSNVRDEFFDKLLMQLPDDQQAAGSVPTAIKQTVESRKEATANKLFYMMDAVERPNGTVFLFGLMEDDGLLKSCCVTVKNVQRNVFLLPKETVTDSSGEQVENNVELVKAELGKVFQKHGINQESVSVKCVTRRYAFEVPGVPVEADWIKLTYPYTEPVFNAPSGETFSHVFGANTGPLEWFILKRKIMGPCWLDFAHGALRQSEVKVSWCELEYSVDNPKQVNIADQQPLIPRLSVMSLIVKTGTKSNEVLQVSAVLFKDYQLEGNTFVSTQQFTVTQESAKALLHSAQGQFHTRVQDERTLLTHLVNMMARWDPDVIIGHDLSGIYLNVLYARLKQLNISNWSRMGRINWSSWPSSKLLTAGRLVCDTLIGAREHVKSKTYTLDDLVESELGLAMIDQDACTQANYQAKLAFKLQLLQLSKQLTNIAGNLWNRTLAGARAERNEYLLLHEFHSLKYICPDRHTVDMKIDVTEDHQGSSKKQSYSGGLVLEPKRGLYESVVMLLDFNSLYPSIIQEYNICFTTVKREPDMDVDLSKDGVEISDTPGILPRIIKSLVEKRRSVKQAMKTSVDEETRASLNISQQALKLTANSMYGCLGFAYSRFHAVALAALITAKGRQILTRAVEVACQNQLNVIYGDTDSIMIDTGLRDINGVKELADKLKIQINSEYKCLEIDLDGVYRKLLLLRKKKYAGVTETGHLETKGLDMVRRDWCRVSVEMGEYILKQLLLVSDATSIGSQIAKRDDKQVIGEYLQKFDLKATPTDWFAISKQLSKDAAKYADQKAPHVQVALKQQNAHAGTVIQYVMCEGQQPYSLDQAQSDPSLKIGTLSFFFFLFIN